MNQFKALLSKEVKEALRDKRALMAAMAMAILAPLIIFIMSKTAVSDVLDKPDVFIVIEGKEYAPNLLQALNNEGIYSLLEASEEEKQQWSERNIELVIPADYPDYMLQARTIDIALRADMSEKNNAAPLRRIKDTIQKHARSISMQRVVLRGLSTSVLIPINIEEQDTSSPNSNAMFINSMLMLYMLFGAFICGLSVAVDTSAGERERNVLELLLSQPVSTTQVVAAKLTSASMVSVLGVVLTLVLTSFAVGFVDLSAIGASFQLDSFTVFILIALLIPICLLASTIQLYLAFQAKTFKEAQSTVSIVILLPAMVPFAMMMMESKPAWLDWLPISGQYLLMEDALKGLPVQLDMVFLVSVVTLAVSAGLFATLAKKLESEKTVLALS